MKHLLKHKFGESARPYNRERLIWAALQDIHQLFFMMDTRMEGLYPAEASERRKDYGANVLPQKVMDKAVVHTAFPLGVTQQDVEMLLKQLSQQKVAVFRSGMDIYVEVDIASLVPGDIIFVSFGDIVPADVRILHARELLVNQYLMTGDRQVTVKSSSMDGFACTMSSITGLPNICLMGTTVIGGMARAVVIGTGSATYLGKMLYGY